MSYRSIDGRHPSVVIVVGFMAAIVGLQCEPASAHAGTDFLGPASGGPGMDAHRPAPADRAQCVSALVTVTGWLTTVWGVAPRYWITDEHGQAMEVLLSEELARPFGGPQALDRQRLTIVGEVVHYDPVLIQALSIAPIVP
jgi:hypothetical protein